MTTEELKTIYDRAFQYFVAKYNDHPETIAIEDDGTLSGEYLESRGCCGDPDDYSWHYFTVEDLTADLDDLVAERKKKEEEARIAEQERRKKVEEERIKREKQQRKEQYFRLKKEFENE